MRRQLKPILLGLTFFATYCTPSNTINVDKKPVFPGEQVPLAELTNEVDQQVVRIGELNEIRQLDPLFATTNGEFRVIHLVYDGLVNQTIDGKITSGIANSWKISPDSLVYEFYLGNKQFHSSDLFFNGSGREVTAEDVELVFKRMGSHSVPPQTARLFWAIRGMDSYFAEQREIYDESKRMLKTIAGVEVIDSKTIRFTLDYKDSDFLNKLSRPEASVYPKEAISGAESVLKSNPIGTGEWRFSGLFQDSIITLRPENQSTNISTEIKRKRIEFYFFKNEVSLYKKFFKEEIDIVPELGPQLSASLLDANGKLEIAYQDKFELYNTTSKTPYTLWFNTANRYGLKAGDAAFLISKNTIDNEFASSKAIVSNNYVLKDAPNADAALLSIFKKPDAKQRLVLAYNGDALSFELLKNVYQSISKDYDAVVLKTLVTGRESIFIASKGSEKPTSNAIAIAQFFVNRTGLQTKGKPLARFSNEPWWIQIDTN
ncbi:hypothetical protein EP331_01650 [bacterium]|nr:MAG: hypothetical protein EP331_01650 [bacterium]